MKNRDLRITTLASCCVSFVLAATGCGESKTPEFRDTAVAEVDFARAGGLKVYPIDWHGQTYFMRRVRAEPIGCTASSFSKGCEGTVRYSLPKDEEYLRCDFNAHLMSGRGTYSYKVVALANSNRQFVEISYNAFPSGYFSGRSAVHLRGDVYWLQKEAPIEMRREYCRFPADGKKYSWGYGSMSTPHRWAAPPVPWPQ